MLSHSSILFNILSFFGAGILLAFTPCVFPMVPILSSILVGEEKLGSKRAFKLSLTFVLSMAFTYAGAGLLVGYWGSTIQTTLQQPWIIMSFALVFVLMALSMFGLFSLRMPRFLQNYVQTSSNKQKSGSYWGVALMGFLATLLASPCVTAPLLAVLTYISQTGDALLGAVILFSLALGMGLPLLLFGLGQGALLPSSGPWMEKVKQFFGVMLLGLALWMLSRILPGNLALFLWSALLIVSPLALGGLERNFPPLLQGLAALVLIYGCILLVGAASGHAKFFRPLEAGSAIEAMAPTELFTKVFTLAEMEQQLRAAKGAKQPVLIEFFASWCETCQEVDEQIFSDAHIQQRLKNFKTLRVDISTKNEALLQLIEHFKVLGTPTLIFYDKEGKKVEAEPFNQGISKKVFEGILAKLT